MSKTYKGYELIKAIADGEINYGTKFKIKDWNEIIEYEQSNLIFRKIFGTGEEGSNYGETIFDLWNLDYILSVDFELLEDEEHEIDIQSIKEVTVEDLTNSDGMGFLREIDKLNEVIRAIKQLDKNK